MPMKPIRYNLLTLLLLLSLNSYSGTRSVDIEKTLQDASSIETIIVCGYTDTTMLYCAIASKDTMSISCLRRKMTKTTRDNLIKAGKDSTSLDGYWPIAGEKIILIVNTFNTLELLARQVGENYRFWDPQSMPLLQTLFLIREKSNFKLINLCKGAEANNRGYYMCWDGCLVDKIYFDTHYGSI
jgi:hypothetical protein